MTSITGDCNKQDESDYIRTRFIILDPSRESATEGDYRRAIARDGCTSPIDLRHDADRFLEEGPSREILPSEAGAVASKRRPATDQPDDHSSSVH